jgi:hypothetical protein
MPPGGQNSRAVDRFRSNPGCTAACLERLVGQPALRCLALTGELRLNVVHKQAARTLVW